MASGGSARATVAANRRRLLADFIFEVTDRGREAAVGGHVWIADESERELEAKGFGECFLLKDTGANHLAGDVCQNLVLAGGENVDPRNLRFLVKLFRAELGRFARAMVLGLFQR